MTTWLPRASGPLPSSTAERVPDFPRKFPRRGEIYWAPLNKVRPVLVVSNDHANQWTDHVTVVAITTQPAAKEYPTDVVLRTGHPLPQQGRILCQSIYTLAKDDLRGYRDDISPEQQTALDKALSVALGLPQPLPDP